MQQQQNKTSQQLWIENRDPEGYNQAAKERLDLLESIKKTISGTKFYTIPTSDLHNLRTGFAVMDSDHNFIGKIEFNLISYENEINGFRRIECENCEEFIAIYQQYKNYPLFQRANCVKQLKIGFVYFDSNELQPCNISIKITKIKENLNKLPDDIIKFYDL